MGESAAALSGSTCLDVCDALDLPGLLGTDEPADALAAVSALAGHAAISV